MIRRYQSPKQVRNQAPDSCDGRIRLLGGHFLGPADRVCPGLWGYSDPGGQRDGGVGRKDAERRETEHLRFTGVWMKQAGRWQEVARHANIVPQP